MGVFQNNLLAASAAAASAGGAGFYSHQIEQSCRFDSGSSRVLMATLDRLHILLVFGLKEEIYLLVMTK
jgi:hypothetical protein